MGRLVNNDVALSDLSEINFDDLERSEEVLDDNLNISKQKAVLLRKVAEKRHRPSKNFRHSRIHDSCTDLFNEKQAQRLSLNSRDKYILSKHETENNPTPSSMQFRSKTHNTKNRKDARCVTLCIVDNLTNEDNRFVNSPLKVSVNTNCLPNSQVHVKMENDIQKPRQKLFNLTQDQIQSEISRLRLVEKSSAKVVTYASNNYVNISNSAVSSQKPSSNRPNDNASQNALREETNNYETTLKQLNSKSPILQKPHLKQNINYSDSLDGKQGKNNNILIINNTKATRVSTNQIESNVSNSAKENINSQNDIPEWKAELLKRKKFTNLIAKLESSINEATRSIVSEPTNVSIQTKPDTIAKHAPPNPIKNNAARNSAKTIITISTSKPITTIQPSSSLNSQSKTIQSPTSVPKFTNHVPDWKRALIEKKKMKNCLA